MIVSTCKSCKFYNPDSEVFVTRTEGGSRLGAPRFRSDMGHDISYDDSLEAGGVSDVEISAAFRECRGRDGVVPFGRTPCHALIELTNIDIPEDDVNAAKTKFTQRLMSAWSSFRRISRLMGD